VGRRLQTGDNCNLRALADAVVAAVWQVDERMLVPVGGPDGNLAFEPRTLLAMLTICYARQIYGSAEVAARLRRDPDFCRVCQDKIPDATTLRRFRSENRPALNFCLKATLRFLAEEKIAQGLLASMSEDHLAEEASRRIITAMFTDSIELDRSQASDGTVELCILVAKGGAAVH